MPKIPTVKIEPDELRKLMDQIGLARKEIARACGLKESGLYAWFTTKEIPVVHYNTLVRLKDNVQNELKKYEVITESQKLEKGFRKTRGQESLVQSVVKNPTLAGFVDQDLIKELEARGWEVNLRLKNPDHGV